MSGAVARLWADAKSALQKREVAIPILLSVMFALWGQHGEAAFDWTWVSGGAIDGRYAEALANFGWGVFLLVIVPATVVKLRRETLAEYGIAAGRVKEGLIWSVVLLAIMVPAVWVSSRDPAMRAVYPLFGPGGGGGAISTRDFALFELGYFGFFLALELGVRGWLLFSIRNVSAPLAVAVSALVQVVWHLGKPPAELASAVVWGIAMAALALRLRSILYILVVHWLANVAMDAFITYGGGR